MRSTRLPDIIISGVKKCGTKTVQRFLLAHPKIVGTRAETFYNPSLNNFPRNLGAWFSRMDINITQNKTSSNFYLVKTSDKSVNTILEGYLKWKKSARYRMDSKV